MYIGDARRDLVEAAHQRLVAQEAPVTKFVGEAEVTVDEAIRSLGPGLHLAILDPFGIKALPFSVVTKLAKVETLDLIIHVSRLGLSRNLGFNVQRKQNAFDRFWPDWRSVYDADQSDPTNLYAIFSGWAAAVAGLGKPVRGTEAIAANGRTLYWLVLVSGHPLAGTFWSKITALHPQRPLLPN